MKRIIGPFAGLCLTIALSACAGLAADPMAIAQAVKILDEGCQRTVDLSLDPGQPGGGALRVTRSCPPAAEAAPVSPPKP